MQKSNSFELIDYLRAMDLCASQCDKDRRALDDYLLHRRKKELTRLVRRCLRNELNEDDRRLVVRHWYRGESVNEIAEALGLDRSTVFRRLAKIEHELYEKLKYALEYRFGECFAAETQRTFHRTLPDLLYDGGFNGIGTRLKQLRGLRKLSSEAVCEQADISPQRLAALEADGSDLTLDELRKLCRCFNVSSDQIIFGGDAFPCANA